MNYECRTPRSGLILPAGRLFRGNRCDSRHFMRRRYLFVPLCGAMNKNDTLRSKSVTEVSLPKLMRCLFSDSGQVLKRVCSIVPLAILGVCFMPQPASGWRQSRPSTSEGVAYGMASKRKGVWSPSKRNTMTQSDMEAVWDQYMKEPVYSQGHSKNKRTKGNIKEFKSSKYLNLNSKDKGIDTVDVTRLDREAVRYSLSTENVAAGCVGAFCIILFMYYWNNKSKEALYGIDLEVQGLNTGSETSVEQGSLFGNISSQDARTLRPRQMTQEEIMLDASKRIQRAKNAQKKFESQSTPVPLDKKVARNSQVDLMTPAAVHQMDGPGIGISIEKDIPKNNTIFQGDEGADEATLEPASGLKNGKDVAVFACALASIFIDGISTEIRNMSSQNFSSSRSLECTLQTQFAGKPLMIRSRKSTEKRQEVPNATRWKLKDMALAPLAPVMKEALDSKPIEILNEKYNPVFEFQQHSDSIKPPSLESDPILSTIRGLADFQGLHTHTALRKYDPISALDQIKEPNNLTNPVKQIIESAPSRQSSGEPDPIHQLIQSLIAFKGPSTFEWIKKYDLLQKLDEIEGDKQPSDYSFLTALIKARPGSYHDDHPWKSLVEIEEPHLKHGERPLKFLLDLAQGDHMKIGALFDKYDMIHNILGDITVPDKSKDIDQLPVSSTERPKAPSTGHDFDPESERNDSI